MATFTEVYKQELKNKGVLSSIGSAALKQTKEKLDPRNILFGGKGLFSVTGQKIFGKGYQAVPKSKKLTEGADLKSDALAEILTSSKNQEGQLSRIDSRLTVIGKNTMPLRAMARDANVTRQNIIKMVKILGGKSTNKADAFFLKQGEEEAAYENKFKRETSVTTKTPTTPEATKKEGLLGSLASFAKNIGSIISEAVSKIPSLILGGIKNLFKNLPSLISGGVSGAAWTAGLLWKGLKFAGTRLIWPLLTSPLGAGILGAAGLAWLVSKLIAEYELDKPVEVAPPVGRDETTGKMEAAGELAGKLMSKIKSTRPFKVAETYGYGKEVDTKNEQQLEEYLQFLEDSGDPTKIEAVARIREQRLSEAGDYSGYNREEQMRQIRARAEERSRVQLGNMSLGAGGFTPNKVVPQAERSSFERGRSIAPSVSQFNQKREMANLIYTEFRKAGYGEAQIKGAIANAMHESSLNPKAANISGIEESIGLFQINRRAHPQYSRQDLEDPIKNTRAMLEIMSKSPGHDAEYRRLSGANEATKFFMEKFERPQRQDEEALSWRTQHLEQIGNMGGGVTLIPPTASRGDALSTASQTNSELRQSNTGTTIIDNSKVTNVASKPETPQTAKVSSAYNTDILELFLKDKGLLTN